MAVVDTSIPGWFVQPDIVSAVDRFYVDLFSRDDFVDARFSRSLSFVANGAEIGHGPFAAHVKSLRAFARSIHFKVLDAAAEAGLVAERHRSRIVDRAGAELLIDTMCFLRFADGRVASIIELYRVVAGVDVYDRLLAADATMRGVGR